MMLFMHAAAFLAALLINAAYIDAAKKKKECSPFPHVSLEHGKIIHASYQKYFFSCDEGYFLATPHVVRCFRGNWTSVKEPKCFKREGVCDEPPEVAHAILHGKERETGSTIRYTCKPGFQLVGKGERTCTRSGHWDGRTPTCMDEAEPLKMVSERLKKSFVNELGSYTEDAPEGRLLDRNSIRHGLDLVFVIDRSSSVDPIDLEIAKKFINFILQRFGVRNEPNKKGGTQAALITFGTEVQIVFNINNYDITGPLAASQAIGTIEPNGGGTNIEGALMMVMVQVAPHLRKNSKKALFLLTDGEPNIANPGITAEEWSNQLKDNFQFEIFTVGIGRGINRNLLADMASKPPLNHVFILDQFTDLNEIMKLIENEPPPAPPISKEQCGYKGHHERNPWNAILYISGGGGLRNMRLCGGVLICSDWVLTAASCLFEKSERIAQHEVFITLGERDLLRDEKNQTNFYALEINVHSKFDPTDPLSHNLALVRLNMPAKRYRPVCLPRTDTNKPLYQDLDANTSIAGWGLNTATPTYPSGATIRFKAATSPVSLATEDECPGMKQDMPLFCAGQGTETCLGLMGSPIIAVDPVTQFYHVLGVVAGRKYCLKGHNQYIELTRYLHWINRSTELCQQKHWTLE